MIYQADVFYITRAKNNMNCRCVKSMPPDKTNGVLCDQHVLLKQLLCCHRLWE